MLDIHFPFELEGRATVAIQPRQGVHSPVPSSRRTVTKQTWLRDHKALNGSQSETETNFTVIQDGFLLDQDQPATKGKRDLKYEMGEGIFLLSTESYAKIKCDMEFALYPFDTQRCTFTITPDKNLTYQEHNLQILFSKTCSSIIASFCFRSLLPK